jgi:hypothetical protein
MAYSKVSVLKKSDNAGRPVSFKDRVTLIDVADILTFPDRDTNGIKISTDITLKAGKTAIQMYATPKTLKAYNTSEGDPDKKGFIHHLEFEHPGDEVEYNEFAENCINKNFVAIVSRFDGTNMRVLGTPGCPLQFSDEGKNDSEAVTNQVKFESLLRGPRIAHYSGSLPTLDAGASGA